MTNVVTSEANPAAVVRAAIETGAVTSCIVATRADLLSLPLESSSKYLFSTCMHSALPMAISMTGKTIVTIVRGISIMDMRPTAQIELITTTDRGSTTPRPLRKLQ